MAAKKKWVAFRTNAIIPKGVLNAEKDKKVNAGEPVQVPASYADHVIHDHFADPSEAPKKPAKKAATTQPAEGAQQTDAEAEAKLATAQQKVDDLNAWLEGESEDHPEWAAKTTELDEAVADLAALKPAS